MIRLKYTLVIINLFFLLAPSFSQQKGAPYKNPALPVEDRVKDLLGRMTPEEKFFQLFMIPGDLENLEPGQYTHGIFGLQVSAGSKGKEDTQQLLQYNTTESGLTLAKKLMLFRSILSKKQD
jgi:beta-glucosidase